MTATSRAQFGMKGIPDEVLTHVGGVSLFQEPGTCNSSAKLNMLQVEQVDYIPVLWPMINLQGVQCPSLALIYWCQISVVLNCTR